MLYTYYLIIPIQLYNICLNSIIIFGYRFSSSIPINYSIRVSETQSYRRASQLYTVCARYCTMLGMPSMLPHIGQSYHQLSMSKILQEHQSSFIIRYKLPLMICPCILLFLENFCFSILIIQQQCDRSTHDDDVVSWSAQC